ncbi:ABC transporter ATP-binding protein [Brevundimonas sp. S30B]|uniref:ABC transporter ATP-binding protein n=1 Tax=unclassified Brevundimonas TaxID=2622653 RepID=UPI0010718142|nr:MULTISPECIES: ABC transporter ATP-binding protein [unclassified Brevundimonas]QBX38172.1 ABC transporter ATP-binding protein [Brevundimonas sp. MF30-B]TFW01692.1 ABC transporter ATP-binding protein [Brevundimonas sp. S30B]
MSDLILDGVSRRYGPKIAVEDVSLTLRPGRITALLGPSGSGKSTLLRLIAGLEQPDAGEIRLGDAVLSSPSGHVAPESRDVGLVFQDYALFPHLTVLANVAFGLGHIPRRRREARALKLLEQVGLGDRARSWPHALSGGEQQRVALMRALAREPRVLLLDEPFSGLDRHMRTSVRDFLFPALKASGAAVAVVTHDAEEALLLADDLALLSQGRLLQTGTPAACYRRPVSPEAARLLGEAATLRAEVSNGRARTAFGELPALDLPDGPAVVVVRPESLRPDPQGVAAQVIDVRFSGAGSDYRLVIGDEALTLRAAEGLAETDATLTVSLDPLTARVYRA